MPLFNLLLNSQIDCFKLSFVKQSEKVHCGTAFPLKSFAELPAKSPERVKQLALVLGACRGGLRERGDWFRRGRGVEAPLSSQRLGNDLRRTKLQVANLSRNLKTRHMSTFQAAAQSHQGAFPPCLQLWDQLCHQFARLLKRVHSIIDELPRLIFVSFPIKLST